MIGRAGRSPEKVPTNKDLRSEGLSHTTVWREKVLGSGNRKCKGPGGHQGRQCGWSEVSEGTGLQAAARIWGLSRVHWVPWGDFELRRDKI